MNNSFIMIWNIKTSLICNIDINIHKNYLELSRNIQDIFSELIFNREFREYRTIVQIRNNLNNICESNKLTHIDIRDIVRT